MRNSNAGVTRSKFHREEWNVGFVRQSAHDIIRHGIRHPVTWLRPGPWEMFADPACAVMPDGNLLLLVERLDWWDGRGEIWAANLDPDLHEDIRPSPWLRAESHLSYPFPFYDRDGNRVFTVECWETGGLKLWYHAEGMFRQVTIMDRQAVDPTFWHDGVLWWLFCGFEDDAPSGKLHLFYASTLTGPWTAHKNNPVKIDPANARPGGPIFWDDGRLIRPAQDCAATYGAALVINEITRLDVDGFEEVPIRRLQPSKAYPDGLHTLCPTDRDITFIDGKRWAIRPKDYIRRFVCGRRTRFRRWRNPSVPMQFAPRLLWADKTPVSLLGTPTRSGSPLTLS